MCIRVQKLLPHQLQSIRDAVGTQEDAEGMGSGPAGGSGTANPTNQGKTGWASNVGGTAGSGLKGAGKGGANPGGVSVAKITLEVSPVDVTDFEGTGGVIDRGTGSPLLCFPVHLEGFFVPSTSAGNGTGNGGSQATSPAAPAAAGAAISGFEGQAVSGPRTSLSDSAESGGARDRAGSNISNGGGGESSALCTN